MDAYVQQKLDELLKQFCNEVSWGATMRNILENDEFELTHARRLKPRAWLLRAKPPVSLQEGFGLAPEILLIAVRGTIQARDLQSAQAEVISSEMRLDPNLVVVTDDTSPRDLQERLERMLGSNQRVGWVWREEDMIWPSLSTVFREKLPTFDVFDERDPVRGAQLMGRATELKNLRTRVSRGDAVGVFGLRKMGKTSLVRAVTDELDPASGIAQGEELPPDTLTQACVLWMDAQTIDLDVDVDDVANEMLAILRRRMRAARVDYPLPSEKGIAGLKLACESLLEKGTPLCFVIDEYDFLFEREEGRGLIKGISRLFRLIRAWAQQWQGAVSLILLGRDPEHLSVPQLDGVTNPLLAWLSPMWLGTLSQEKANDMLRRLGRRVGLDVGHQSAALARRWTGGHPMLHRQFGAALREEILSEVSGPFWNIPTDPHCARSVDRFLTRDALLDVDREILTLLTKRYEPAYKLLVELAGTNAPERAVELAGGIHGPGTRVLRNFGILEQGTLTIPEHLRWYIQTVVSPQLRAVG